MNRRGWIGSFLLLAMVVAAGVGLAGWKYSSIQETQAASANQPEPMEAVTVAVAQGARAPPDHYVHRNGPGPALDHPAQRASRHRPPGAAHPRRDRRGGLGAGRTRRLRRGGRAESAGGAGCPCEIGAQPQTKLERGPCHVAEEEVDRARAERDVALAQIARTKAIIARKTIRAPFRARVGIADVHPGQYLNEGTQLTTLQGVDDAAHVDFTVAQAVAAGLRVGDSVDVFPPATIRRRSPPGSSPSTRASIPTTRNAMVRARIERRRHAPAPGASVRVQVPVGPPRKAVAVPVSALRKGPAATTCS